MDVEGAEENQLKKLYPFVDEKKTPLPSCWNRNDKYPSLSLTQGNARVRVRGRGSQVPAAIRSDHPIPAACGLYYFEILVKDKGRQGCISVGISQECAPLDRMPGFCEGSFGYSAENGKIFAGSESGLPYGPTFSSGDVIGCGINFAENTCFYTKNGQSIGIAFKNIEGTFYVAVGLLTSGETVDANFGQMPFVYNIYEEIEDAQARVHTSICNYVLPSSKSEWLQKLVSNYLVHHGFSATAESFNSDYAAHFSKEAQSRQGVLNLVKRGRFDEAILQVQELHSHLFEQKPELLLSLKCQEFFETLTGYYDEQRSYQSSYGTSTCKPLISGEKLFTRSCLSTLSKCRRSKFHSTSNSLRSSPMLLKSARPLRRSASPMPTELVLNGCETFRSSSPEYFDPSTSMENGTKNTVYETVIDDFENGTHEASSCERPTQVEDCADGAAIFYDASPFMQNGVDGVVCDADGDCPMADLTGSDENCVGISSHSAVNCAGTPSNAETRIERFIAHGRELFEMHAQLKEQNGDCELLTKSYQILRDAFDLIAFTDPVVGLKPSQLNRQRRDAIVLALNGAMLEMQECSSKSALDITYSHAQRLRMEMAKHGLGAAAFADADHFLKG